MKTSTSGSTPAVPTHLGSREPHAPARGRRRTALKRRDLAATRTLVRAFSQLHLFAL